MALDPISVSRELSRAADAATDWQQQQGSEAEPSIDPFAMYRPALGRTRFMELTELPHDDPMRDPLLRWTHFLTEQRINAAWSLRVAEVRHRARPLPTSVGGGKCSLADMLTNALCQPPRRAAWWSVLAAEASELSETEVGLWQRRQLIATELGLEGPDDLQSPCADTERWAWWVIEQCDELLAEYRATDVALWLERVLGQDLRSAFPARLNEAALYDWLREARLLDDVPFGRFVLPRRLGPSSYLRALDEFGRELRRACASTRQPFVIAHDPLRREDAVYGACFAWLLLNPDFLQRRLGLSAGVMRDQRRLLAVSVGFEWALRAAKVVLRAAALRSPKQASELFTELGHRVLGFELAPSLLHVAPRLRCDDPQRFAAVAGGLSMSTRLTEAHDLDWYRNPRAAEQIRAEAQLSPLARIEPAMLEQQCIETLATLRALL